LFIEKLPFFDKVLFLLLLILTVSSVIIYLLTCEYTFLSSAN